jgi:endonuclease YncB( thermonuclease family)
MILLCLMAILLISGCSRSGTTWQVIGGSVYDGDTFRATNGHATIKVRLCGIDAPEKQQRLGIAARDHLRSMLAEGEVRLVSAEQDRYGRLVAEAFTPKGQFINAEMVRSGLAWHYATYSDRCPHQRAIVQAESQAKSARRGVFRSGNQPPWEWRHRHHG